MRTVNPLRRQPLSWITPPASTLAGKGKGIAYTRDYCIPIALFSGRIVHRNTIHLSRGKVTAGIPNLISAKAGNGKDVLGDAFVHCRRLWKLQPVLHECCGELVPFIRYRIDRQISTTITRLKRAAGQTVFWLLVGGKYAGWHIDAHTGFKLENLDHWSGCADATEPDKNRREVQQSQRIVASCAERTQDETHIQFFSFLRIRSWLRRPRMNLGDDLARSHCFGKSMLMLGVGIATFIALVNFRDGFLASFRSDR